MGNNKIICVVICFFVGVLVYYLLKESCGCKVVEGAPPSPGYKDKSSIPGYLELICEEVYRYKDKSSIPGFPKFDPKEEKTYSTEKAASLMRDAAEPMSCGRTGDSKLDLRAGTTPQTTCAMTCVQNGGTMRSHRADTSIQGAPQEYIHMCYPVKH